MFALGMTGSMPRTLSLLALGALAAALLVAPTPAAAKKVPPTCDLLTGPVVMQTANFKIVQRRHRDVPRRVRRGKTKAGFVGHSFYGCTLPAGVVNKLGSKGTTYLYERGRKRKKVRRVGIHGNSDTTFSNPVGDFVLSRSDDSIEGGPSAGNYSIGQVHNIGNGESYVYWSDESQNPNAEFVSQPPSKLILSEEGRLATIFDDPRNEDQRTVRGFGTTGTQIVLDTVDEERKNDIPLESLALDGTTVSWMNAGQPRTGQATP